MAASTHKKPLREKEEEHGRLQFQVDRIAFFSDAVIAIAITLLVLEIKIPPLGKDSSWNEIKLMLGTKLVHPLIALSLCFITIGSLWIKHHQLFEHINTYNHRLIQINLYFLLSVVLLPISTSFMQEENNPVYIRSFVFTQNLFVCYLTYYLMLFCVFHKKNCFSTLQSRPVIRKMHPNALAGTVIFFSMSILSLLHATWFFIPIVAFPLMSLLKRIKIRSQARPPAATA